MGTVERHTFMITRANNGKITLERPINNIKWLRVANVFFKHGPKKKTRKKKKRNDSDSDDEPYEHGNPDLIDSTYVMVKVNDFIRGRLYDVDGSVVREYTARIFTDIDDNGEGEWTGDSASWTGTHDWDAVGNNLKKIEELNIDVSTSEDPSPSHINLEIELEFGIGS